MLVWLVFTCFEAHLPLATPVMSPMMAPNTDCVTILTNVSDCLPYVQIGSNMTVPDKACCPEVAGLLESNPMCLCELRGQAESFGVDVNRASMLRDACKVEVPSLDIICPAPPISEPSPVESYAPNYGGPTADSIETPSPPPTTPGTVGISPLPCRSPFLDHQKKAPAPSLKITTTKDNKKASHKVGLVIGLVVPVLSILAATVVFYYFMRRNKHRRHEVRCDAKMNKDFEQGTGPKRFSYNEIFQATAGFAEKNKLGEGGFGGVYKGFLKDSETYIAVKRVSKTSEQGIREYTTEVRIISRLRHKNLVELKGWCHEKGELLLIYEFMENGSLDSHLFKKKSLLTWDKRKRIAYGLASALTYLHEDCKECILHRDIKSSNVMLDSNFDAKLGDFGLAKLVDHEKGAHTTMLAGTLGYMAPEYVVTGKVSKESDVFSFGVVALEIVCGRKSLENKAHERQVKLVEWVWDLYGTGSFLEAVDLSLGLDNTEELERLLIVGLWCAHPHANLRPSMRQANQVLNSEASLPILPPKMPKITFYSPPTLSELGDYSSGTSGSSTISSKLTTSSTTSYANLRPSMRQVNQVLNSEASLPILPPKMPKITFYSPPTLSELGDYSSGTSGSSTISSKLTTSSTTSSPAALLYN